MMCHECLVGGGIPECVVSNHLVMTTMYICDMI